ncbi:hypothetical protein N7474_003343 [Penicillium riverlandense]|uniref:uncharacterized protein n=1 Tax=Penicillium riverlandense TaxID=1903569 RepID=UPI0025469BCA|nr:uncharacterized protein N7474_003343 [Penicillium riverlandense]KAJ5826205.1 hypothetical protein N7474_003343 [Penicillium riverlandense]
MLESLTDVRIPLRRGPTPGHEVAIAVISIALGNAAVVVNWLVEIARDRVELKTEAAILDLDPEVLALGAGEVEVVCYGGEVVLVFLGFEGFPRVEVLDAVDFGTV